MYEYRRLSPEQRRELVAERLRRGHPPHQPPHFDQGPGLYLLTAACFEHKSLISTPERRDVLLDLFFERATIMGVTPVAWVVVPNHYHVLAHVPHIKMLGPIFRRVHGFTSHEWNGEDGARERKVWCRYTDRFLRSERHKLVELNYIHAHPWKHGLVDRLQDWKWSSFHWYLEHYGREHLLDIWNEYPIKELAGEREWDVPFGADTTPDADRVVDSEENDR